MKTQYQKELTKQYKRNLQLLKELDTERQKRFKLERKIVSLENDRALWQKMALKTKDTKITDDFRARCEVMVAAFKMLAYQV